MNRVAVAAHHAGRRRDIVGDDPVAALAREFGLGVVDQMLGLGGKADHQRRPPVPQFRDRRKDIGIFHQLQRRHAARKSSSASARPHWRRASRRRRRRRSRCPPAARLPPGAACRARIRHASPSTPAGIVEIDRAGDQGDVRAGRLRRRGNGKTLFAGGAVGDVAHRIDRLVRRARGDQHALARERARLRRAQQALGGGRYFQSAPPSGRRRPRRLRPSRRHWVRSWRCHRARAARHCGGSRHCSTSAGSSPAPAGSAGWPQAEWRWRDRRRGPAPSSPSGRRSRAPPRSDRSRGQAGYGRHRTRSRDRTGRCRRARSTARSPPAA